MKRHTSVDGTLSLEIPEGWSPLPPEAKSEILAATTDDSPGSYLPNLSVSVETLAPDDKRDSAGYYVGNYIYLEHHVEGFESLSSGELALPGGPVRWCSYLRKFEPQLTLAVTQYFIVRRSRAYIVTCFALPAEQDAMLPRFHAIVASIQFTDTPGD